MSAAVIAMLLAQMGVEHVDANETAAFSRQLEYVKTQTFDVKYLDHKARSLIPVDGSIPNGAESFVWRAWDWHGMAAIISNFADDLPKVDVMAAEVVQGIKSLGASYGYSVQDLRAAQMAGVQLETKRATAARRAIENQIENIAAMGNSAAGLPGFLNNANVPLLTASGSDINGDWANPLTTSQEILDDLNTIANSVVETTKHTHIPDTMVLPTSRYSKIATKPYSANDTRSVLRVFLENSPYVRNVDQWYYLDTADAALTGPRVVCYERSPEVLELVIPQEFEQFPPQARGLSFEINCHARIAGVSVRYPMAIVYADGV